MAEASVPGYRTPKLIPAKAAREQTLKSRGMDADKLNLGLLVESVDTEIKNATSKGDMSIRYRVPSYCGGSLYDVPKMRRHLALYLMEAGYHCEEREQDVLLVHWKPREEVSQIAKKIAPTVPDPRKPEPTKKIAPVPETKKAKPNHKGKGTGNRKDKMVVLA